jgi:hypothetical protein
MPNGLVKIVSGPHDLGTIGVCDIALASALPIVFVARILTLRRGGRCDRKPPQFWLAPIRPTVRSCSVGYASIIHRGASYSFSDFLHARFLSVRIATLSDFKIQLLAPLDKFLSRFLGPCDSVVIPGR